MPGLIFAASSGEKPSAASERRAIALREDVGFREQLAHLSPCPASLFSSMKAESLPRPVSMVSH